MPVIKSAIKKLRKDRKREKVNDAQRAALESAIRKARKSPSKINAAFSAIDRAVKKNIIHKNKAARIKSSLSKLSKPQRSREASPTSRNTPKKLVAKSPSKVKKSRTKTAKK